MFRTEGTKHTKYCIKIRVHPFFIRINPRLLLSQASRPVTYGYSFTHSASPHHVALSGLAVFLLPIYPGL